MTAIDNWASFLLPSQKPPWLFSEGDKAEIHRMLQRGRGVNGMGWGAKLFSSHCPFPPFPFSRFEIFCKVKLVSMIATEIKSFDLQNTEPLDF